MARTPRALRKAKTPTKRVSYTEAQLINAKYLGKEEPTYDHTELTSTEYGRMLNWYNYMSSAEESREWLNEYLEALDRTSDVEILKQLPLYECSAVAGHVARIILRGFVPPTDSTAFIERHVSAALAKYQPPVTVIDDELDKESRLLMVLEAKIARGEKFDVGKWFADNRVTAATAQMIAEYQRPRAVELAATLKRTKDKVLMPRLIMFSEIIKACDSFTEIKAEQPRKVRKPRAKRPVSVEKKLKLVKWQQNSAEFGISSVDPSKVLGASEAVLFNTKWNTITVLRGKLDINRTSIVGYDEARSESKRIGRGAKQRLTEIAKANTKRLEKLLAEIDTAPVDIKDRFNENIVIVRVIM